MISRKERIKLEKYTILDCIRDFWDEYGSWILIGVLVGTVPFIPFYFEFVLSRFDFLYRLSTK